MKRFYAVLLAIIITNMVIAQNDPNAKKILDAVSAKVKTFKGISASFVIKSITSKGKDNGSKSGTISIKGQKYLLKQDKNEIICDGNKTYTYDPANKTITVSAADDANQTLTPQNLLSNFYDKDFTYKLISSKGNFHEVELVPNDKRKNFQKVNVFIDKSKSMITKARVLDKSNNTIEFSLSNLNTKAVLTDNLFTFIRTKYPADVEVLD
jgi:outer membrane lipoprotein-sorting protein